MKWAKVAVYIAIVACVFMAGFMVAGGTLRGGVDYHVYETEPSTGPGTQVYAPVNTPEPTAIAYETEKKWLEFLEMTVDDMRESIATLGAAAFEDATGWDIVFDNLGEIISVHEPHVLARGYSSRMQMHIQVLFTYRQWRDGWSISGYSLWDEWRMQPQLTRGTWEGRRHIDADTVDVRFYGIVDWGGGEVAPPIYASILGNAFSEEFVRLFNQYVNTWDIVNILDIWFIGDNRVYVNLDGAVMFGQGSAGGFAISASLYRTLFSIPGVDEVVVLVDGQAETVGDHVGFGYINRRDDPYIQMFLKLGSRRLSTHLAEVFAAVLQDEMPFMYFTYTHSGHVDWVTGSVLSWRPFSDAPIFLYEYLDSAPYIFTYHIERFAIIDMDGDGVSELVLASQPDGDSLILHYGGDGVVYGFGIPYRQFRFLKEDGTFTQLSWMQDWGSIARVNFVRDGTQAHMELEFLYEWEQVFKYYDGVYRLTLYLNGELFTDFEEGWAILELARGYQDNKDYVIWYLFADFKDILNVR